MNFLQSYVAYLRDNPNRYWFKRKLYGWGWTPATKEGWLIILVFITLVILNFMRIDNNSHSGSDTLINFVPQTFILMLILVCVCYKTGEKPKWQWGNKASNKDIEQE